VIPVSTALVACGGGLAWMITQQVLNVASEIPIYRENVEAKLNVIRTERHGRLSEAADTVNGLVGEFTDAIGMPRAQGDRNEQPVARKPAPRGTTVVVESKPNPSLLLVRFVDPVLGTLATGALVIVFSIFMLVRREDLRDRIFRLAGRGRLSTTTQALDEATARVSRYLAWEFLVNTGYGVVVSIGLSLLGVPNPFIWGVLAGLLRFAPYVGPMFGIGLPVLFSFGAFSDWKHGLYVLAMLLVIEMATAYLIEPMLYGSQTGITPFAIIVAVVFWTALWGPVGLLISTPITVTLVAFGKYLPQLEFFTILFGCDTSLAIEAQIYQRLLARNPDEAFLIAEAYAAENSIEQLYDSVLIPVLILTAQDFQRENLDANRQSFVFRCMRDMIEDLGRDIELPIETEKNESSRNIVCIPVRDEGDELVGMMLSQVAARNSCTVETLRYGSPAEYVRQIAELKPSALCISALPPFAFTEVRSLYRTLKRGNQNIILVGLWQFNGEPANAEERIKLSPPDKLVATLSDVLQQVETLCEQLPSHAD
jgi:predicted PurR-regulated permease PerM